MLQTGWSGLEAPKSTSPRVPTVTNPWLTQAYDKETQPWDRKAGCYETLTCGTTWGRPPGNFPSGFPFQPSSKTSLSGGATGQPLQVESVKTNSLCLAELMSASHYIWLNNLREGKACGAAGKTSLRFILYSDRGFYQYKAWAFYLMCWFSGSFAFLCLSPTATCKFKTKILNLTWLWDIKVQPKWKLFYSADSTDVCPHCRFTPYCRLAPILDHWRQIFTVWANGFLARGVKHALV